MRKFGLIGFPLGHSFSKKYFSEKFSGEGIIDCIYENYPLTGIGELPQLIASEPLLAGLNVTIPYKSEVINYLGEIDNKAAEIGAVNVLKIKREGDKIVLSGVNSDITGIEDSLRPLLRPAITNAIVLGTGGSSRAVRHILRKLGIKFTLVSREPKPDCITYRDITPGVMHENPLIINTTPLGMFPDSDSKPSLDYDLITNRHVLFDLVYNPELTTFLRLGQERGAMVMNGLKMLIRQAERSWEIWNDENL